VVFDDVWETIQDRYYDPRFRGIDWQAKRVSTGGGQSGKHA
jgi:hypothetical protein